MASDLAARLKNRGVELPSFSAEGLAGPAALSAATVGFGGKRRPASGVAPAAAIQHAPLAASSAERNLFTPLAEQGGGAIKEEQRRKEAGEKDLLHEVKVTLKKWVQECLARDEKRAKLLEKGMLKCRVQAQWSEGLHEKMKALIATYEGKVMVDGGKENEGTKKEHPSWLPRQEKWMVGFDATAFQRFVDSHPEALEPGHLSVCKFIDDFAENAQIDTMRVKDFSEALEARFGPLRRPLLDRAKELVVNAIKARHDPASKKGIKRKGDETQQGAGAKRPCQDPKIPQISSKIDAAWAAALLAPFGLGGEGGASLVLRAPAATAKPLIEALRPLDTFPFFHDALRETQLGRILAAYRSHSCPAVAQSAKELVAAWKAACRGVASTSK